MQSRIEDRQRGQLNPCFSARITPADQWIKLGIVAAVVHDHKGVIHSKSHPSKTEIT
jgi:nitrogen-specific signal transduction histidine kinase